MTDKNREDTEKKAGKPAGEEAADPKTAQPEQAEAVSMEFTDEDIDTIGEIGNVFMGSASTTLSRLLKQEVRITAPEVKVLDSIDELLIPKKESLIVEINYTQGLDGNVLLVIKKEEAALIADIMGGGTGIPAAGFELGEDNISAVEEAMNQIVGNASTALSTMLNMTIAISPPNLRISENGAGLPQKDVVSIKFNFKIGDLAESELYQLIPLSAAKAQVRGAAKVMKSMTENFEYNSSQSIVDDFIQKEQSQAQEEKVTAGTSASYSGGQQNPQNQITVQPVQFASFDNASDPSGSTNQNLNLVMDVNLGLTVELGKAELPIKNVLELTRGSIIELDKVAGEPVELYANGKLIAKGEVVVIEDNFGLRITSIVSPELRIKHL